MSTIEKNTATARDVLITELLSCHRHCKNDPLTPT